MALMESMMHHFEDVEHALTETAEQEQAGLVAIEADLRAAKINGQPINEQEITEAMARLREPATAQFRGTGYTINRGVEGHWHLRIHGSEQAAA